MFVRWSDIDECSTQRGVCRNGQCVNTVGTFLCVCNDGYELSLDGRLCSGKELPLLIFYTLNVIWMFYSTSPVYSFFFLRY